MYCSYFSMLQMCNDCKYFVTGYCRQCSRLRRQWWDYWIYLTPKNHIYVLTEGEMSFTLYENTNMANTRNMYCYFETRTTWHRGLELSVSDFGTRGPGSIRGWAHITFFLFLFSSCNAKLLHTRNMELYKWQKLHSLNFKLNYPPNMWGWG